MATLLPQRRHTAPPALVAQALEALEQEIGGRDALVAALSHAPRSKDIQYVLGLVGDPRSKSRPLADLCAQGGITAGELIQAYSAGEIARAQALATAKVGAQLAEVAADTMRMALPREQTCQVCGGTGTFVAEPSKKVPNPNPLPCTACDQSGKITAEGDVEHKKLALEMGRLLQKGGGGISLNVNQQVGVQVGSAGGALEKLQAATDAILYGEGPLPQAAGVVEAEVLESSPSIVSDGPMEDGDWRDALHD